MKVRRKRTLPRKRVGRRHGDGIEFEEREIEIGCEAEIKQTETER